MGFFHKKEHKKLNQLSNRKSTLFFSSAINQTLKNETDIKFLLNSRRSLLNFQKSIEI